VKTLLEADDGPYRDATGTLLKETEDLSKTVLEAIADVEWCDDRVLPPFPVELFNKEPGTTLNGLGLQWNSAISNVRRFAAPSPDLVVPCV
jgi:hypothetical protein